MWQWSLIPVAYLLGSLSSAVIVSRILGLPDPRQEGSKNPGATNVLRLSGKKAGALTFLGDMSKGIVSVLLAKAAGSSIEVVAAVGLAAFVGHLYPVFFGFRGGKGVATACGVCIGYSLPLGLAVAATWVAVFYVSRISSLAALTAATLAPIYLALGLPQAAPAFATVIMSTLLIWRHAGNIRRLLKGEEKKF
jgi:glycerol-3-phosphate acyltransferase PlsY